MSLRKKGASIGSATALWLGNPTLNPAVLAFIVLTLGWPWAVLRVTLGAALVLGGALLASRLATHPGRIAPDAGAHEASPGTAAEPGGQRGAPGWLRNLLRLAVRLTPEYIVMVALLGAARAFFFPSGGLHLGGNPLVLAALAVLGTLFVIPTAGEIPIIQTMLAAGVGAGPAGALLLTLAPVSLPSLLMLARVLPVRVLALLAGLTAATGLLAGLVAHAFAL